MSDLILNIRFGATHFQIGKHSPWVRVSRNKYWVDNPPGFTNWFKVYKLFGYTGR